MRWHVSLAGKSSGPWEELDVSRMASAGQIDHVQAESGGPWLPLAHSPFAVHLPGAMAAVLPPPKASLTSAQWLFILGSLGLLALAVLAGWLGILLGIGLAGWSIVRYREGQPSLMDLAWGTPRGLAKTSVTIA